MVRISVAASFILIIIVFIRCHEDVQYVRDYPQITSSKIKDITNAGVDVEVVLNAETLDKITDMGAVWGTNPDLDTKDQLIMYLGKPGSATITIEVRNKMEAGKEYFLKVFLVGDKKTVYGLPLKFTSKGSEGPIIKSITPPVFVPGDLITITGMRFGTDKTKTVVNFSGNNRTSKATINSITDTQIVVTAPEILAPNVNIVLSIPNDIPVTSSMTISRKLPKLDNISASDLCSNIVVSGLDILILGQPTALSVNGKNITPLPNFSNTTFSIAPSNHAAQLTVKLSYSQAGYNVTQTFNDNTPRPVVNNEIPPTIPDSQEFTLTGTNFPACGLLSVATEVAGKTEVEITDVKINQVTVKVNNAGCDAFKLKLLYNGQQIYLSNSISQAPINIASISPDHGIVGDKIIVNGTNLFDVEVLAGGGPDFPNLGYQQLVEGTSSMATVTLQPPPSPIALYKDANNKTTLSVGKCTTWKVFTFDYQLYNLTLGGISPTYNPNLEPLVITGTHFTSDPRITVNLRRLPDGYLIPLTQLTITDTKITAQLPQLTLGDGIFAVELTQWGYTYQFNSSMRTF